MMEKKQRSGGRYELNTREKGKERQEKKRKRKSSSR